MQYKKWVFIAGIILLIACEENKETKVAVEPTIQEPELILPVQYSNWEFGKREYANTVLELYKSFDGVDSFDVDQYFGDTLHLRLPTERNEIVIPNPQINKLFGFDRKFFKQTSNRVISILSLRDKDSGQDWVFATLYNSWTEKNGRRDSVLLHEKWLLKEGKIHTLLSFEKKPTAEFLNRNLPNMK